MKRLSVLAVLVSMSLWLAGCGETKTPDSKVKIPSPVEQASQGADNKDAAGDAAGAGEKDGAKDDADGGAADGDADADSKEEAGSEEDAN
ncbi:MAG: hypothetical protein ACKV0T_14890 [Planctomycetales bacterium]